MDNLLDKLLLGTRQFMSIKPKEMLGYGMTSIAYPLKGDRVVTKTDTSEKTKFLMYRIFQKYPRYFPRVDKIDEVRGIVTLEKLDTDKIKKIIEEMSDMIRDQFDTFLINDQLAYEINLNSPQLSIEWRKDLEGTLCKCFKGILFNKKDLLNSIERNIALYLENTGYEGWSDMTRKFLGQLFAITPYVIRIREDEFVPYMSEFDEAKLDFHFGNLAYTKEGKLKYIDI